MLPLILMVKHLGHFLHLPFIKKSFSCSFLYVSIFQVVLYVKAYISVIIWPSWDFFSRFRHRIQYINDENIKKKRRGKCFQHHFFDSRQNQSKWFSRNTFFLKRKYLTWRQKYQFLSQFSIRSSKMNDF